MSRPSLWRRALRELGHAHEQPLRRFRGGWRTLLFRVFVAVCALALVFGVYAAVAGIADNLWVGILAEIVLFGMFGLMAYAGSTDRRERALQRDRRKQGLCAFCEYPLHGLPGKRCPECGRGFRRRIPSRPAG